MFNFLSRCKKISLINAISTSLKAKLIVIFAILTTIPLSVVGIVSYTKSFSAIQENTINSTTQLAEQLNQSIMLTFQIGEKFSTIGQNETTIKFLTVEDGKNGHETYEIAKQMIKLFKLFRTTFDDNKWIEGVYIIGFNGNNISEAQGVYKLNKSMQSISTINKILSERDKIHIIPNHYIDYSREIAYNDVISLGTTILKPVTYELLGVIIVDINKSAIEELCKNIRIGSSGYFSVISEEKGVVTTIFSSDPNLKNSELKNEYIERVIKKQSGYFIEKINGQKEFIVYNTLSNTGWKIIGIVKLKDLMQRAYSIRNITIIVVVLCIMSTAVLYLFISDKLTLPIIDLKNKMRQAEDGNFLIKAEPKNRDEIAELSRSFNKMLEKIKQLIENNKREQEAFKKSELKAMQAQINPHFLYNTLDAIVWMAEAKNNDQVVKITKALSSFFRITLSKGKEWISLNEEIEHARGYLIIQKMRYRDILDYRIDIDESIINCRILKLVLQPIVENALYHGIKNKRMGGHITVKASKVNEDKLLLEVIDNGNGMTDERLENVIKSLEDDGPDIVKEGGFGLRNVNQRIKLYYGRQYGLTIKSKHKIGTHVSIIIPKVGWGSV